MSLQKLPKVPPLFKNTIQKQQIALKMTNYRKKLYQIQKSKSKYIMLELDNQNSILKYKDLFQQNPKKNYMLQKKYMQIQRQNKLLFQKISKIHNNSINKDNGISNNHRKEDRSIERIKSLNITMRKRQVSQIQLENTKMLGRIKNQKPSISFKDIDKQYLKKRKFSQKLSKLQKYKLQDWY